MKDFMDLNDEDVREILRILDSSAFDELRLDTGRFKLTLRRSGAGGGWTEEREALAPASAAEGDAEAKSGGKAKKTAPSAEEGVADVPSPILGTFYRSPKPGAAPFVEVGAKVEEDTIIGIVETMKLMNTVRAGLRGEIVEICASNGEVVEYHDVLMRVRLEAK